MTDPDDRLSADAVESALRFAHHHVRRYPETGYTSHLHRSLAGKWRIVRGEWFPPGSASQHTIRRHRRLYPERYDLEPDAFDVPDGDADQATLSDWGES